MSFVRQPIIDTLTAVVAELVQRDSNSIQYEFQQKQRHPRFRTAQHIKQDFQEIIRAANTIETSYFMAASIGFNLAYQTEFPEEPVLVQLPPQKDSFPTGVCFYTRPNKDIKAILLEASLVGSLGETRQTEYKETPEGRGWVEPSNKPIQ